MRKSRSVDDNLLSNTRLKGGSSSVAYGSAFGRSSHAGVKTRVHDTNVKRSAFHAPKTSGMAVYSMKKSPRIPAKVSDDCHGLTI